MRKTLLALAAATTLAFGTMANPTKSEAHPAALAVVGIVVAVVVVTAIVANAVAAPAPQPVQRRKKYRAAY